MDQGSSSSRELQPGELLGQFEIRGLLGEGGMGRVYLARDTGLNRDVALKVMQSHLAHQAESRERFLREARSVAALNHPRIVDIYQVDAGEMPFFAMELLDGESLADYLKRHSIRDYAFTTHIVRQVAEGLAAAHRKQIIHRDIKPSNVWIESAERGRGCKVLDFGLARRIEGDQITTQIGTVMGTPVYMSPEQWRGANVDHRSDLYSLGVILHYMTTGEYPYGTTNPQQILAAIGFGDPIEPKKKNPQIPDHLLQLMVRLLQIDPAKRPQTAEEVVQALGGPNLPAPAGTKPMPPLGPNLTPSEEGEFDPPSNADFPTLEIEPKRRHLKWYVGIGVSSLLVLLATFWRLGGSSNSSSVVDPNPAIDQLSAEIRQLHGRIETLIQTESKTRGEFERLQKTLLANPKSNQEDLDRLENLKKELAEGNEKRMELEQKLDELTRREKSLPPSVPKNPLPLDCTGPTGCDPKEVRESQEKWGRFLNLPTEISIDLGEAIRVEFVLIPPGQYLRGASPGDPDSEPNEKPQKPEAIGSAFYLGRFEVTRAQFERFVKAKKAYRLSSELGEGGFGWNEKLKIFSGPDKRFSWKETGFPADGSHPVVNVSWIDCKAFCAWIEEAGALSFPLGFRRVRLPREVEWEYAARAGSRSIYISGSNDVQTIHRIGNICDASLARLQNMPTIGLPDDRYPFTAPVGRFEANPFGLYDLTGNVSEWCEDAYQATPLAAPPEPSPDASRSIRGGSFQSESRYCRVSFRDSDKPSQCSSDLIGFRMILVAK